MSAMYGAGYSGVNLVVDFYSNVGAKVLVCVVLQDELSLATRHDARYRIGGTEAATKTTAILLCNLRISDIRICHWRVPAQICIIRRSPLCLNQI